MTDKEWLEDLKDQYHFYVEKGIAFNLEHFDVERLFMQAERVQELEEENKHYKQAMQNAINACKYTNPEVAYILSEALEREST